MFTMLPRLPNLQVILRLPNMRKSNQSAYPGSQMRGVVPNRVLQPQPSMLIM